MTRFVRPYAYVSSATPSGSDPRAAYRRAEPCPSGRLPLRARQSHAQAGGAVPPATRRIHTIRVRELFG